MLGEETVELLAKEALDLDPGQMEQERNALDHCLQKLSSQNRELCPLAVSQTGRKSKNLPKRPTVSNSLTNRSEGCGKTPSLRRAGTGHREPLTTMKPDDSSELIQSYFLGTIPEEGMAELDQRLQKDPELRAQFAATARLETNLRDAASRHSKF